MNGIHSLYNQECPIDWQQEAPCSCWEFLCWVAYFWELSVCCLCDAVKVLSAFLLLFASLFGANWWTWVIKAQKFYMSLFLDVAWSGFFLEESQENNTGGKVIHCFLVIPLYYLRIQWATLWEFMPWIEFQAWTHSGSERAHIAETVCSVQLHKPSSQIISTPLRVCIHQLTLWDNWESGQAQSISSVLQVKPCREYN